MNQDVLDGFRKVLNRAGFKKQSQRLARRLLERVLVVGESGLEGIWIRRADIGSALLDEYPPAKLKKMLIEANLALCPDSFGAMQWFVIPTGKFRAFMLLAGAQSDMSGDDAFSASMVVLQGRLNTVETQLADHEKQIDDIWVAIKHIVNASRTRGFI